jgi:hypothetical protein
MTYVDWMIKGPKVGGCNCAYGCPCEFNAPPTHGACEGLECMEIEEGHFGDLRLDGLLVGAAYYWPGAVHEGGGKAQGYIDERASEDQVDALFKILGGEEQEPTTPFNIYGSTIESELDPVFAPIEFACDLEQRTARFVVPGHLEFSAEPIRNPVTGARHFAQIRLPNGFEYREAEMASGRFQGFKDWNFQHSDCYGVMWYAAYGPRGIIE